MTDPTVSVVMASYNAGSFIAETIESVLAQTYDAMELIVVDDASSDGTAEIISRYAEQNGSRVRSCLKASREGPCRARNQALGLARGRYVAWIDHDDLWAETKLEEQVRVLEADASLGLVYSYFDAFDSASGKVLTWSDGRRDQAGDVLGDLLRIGCFIGSITALFRKEALDRRGGRLRERDFSIGDDYYLWLTIALDWKVARIPRTLAYYRRHATNESTRVASAIDMRRWHANLIVEFIDEFPEAIGRLTPTTRLALAARLLRIAGAGRSDERSASRGLAQTAVRLLAAVPSSRTAIPRGRVGR